MASFHLEQHAEHQDHDRPRKRCDEEGYEGEDAMSLTSRVGVSANGGFVTPAQHLLGTPMPLRSRRTSDFGGQRRVLGKHIISTGARRSVWVAASPRPWCRRLFHLLLPTLGGPCPSIGDQESSSP